MPYSIETDNISGVITVRYSGCVDLNERLMAVKKVCQMIADIENVRLLIDIRNISMKMSVEDQEYFGKYVQINLKYARHENVG